MSKTIMLCALALGLTPWFAPFLVEYAYPWVTRPEAWRIAGVTVMCMWVPCCLLVGLAACKWVADGAR